MSENDDLLEIIDLNLDEIDTDSKQLLSKYSNVRIAQQFDKIQLA